MENSSQRVSSALLQRGSDKGVCKTLQMCDWLRCGMRNRNCNSQQWAVSYNTPRPAYPEGVSSGKVVLLSVVVELPSFVEFPPSPPSSPPSVFIAKAESFGPKKPTHSFCQSRADETQHAWPSSMQDQPAKSRAYNHSADILTH
eukprot:7439-Pyramimonas_sp.AAC.2